MCRTVRLLICASWVLLVSFASNHGRAGGAEAASQIRADEEVVFFPTAAQLSDDGQSWIAPIHGWIFEPEENDLLRATALRQLDDVLGHGRDDADTTILAQRLRPFLVDNERGKQVGIRIAGTEQTLPPSTNDGHFEGTVRLAAAAVESRLSNSQLQFQAIVRADDRRQFSGTVYCLPPRGVSVISDVDDTIKVSDVRNKQELLKNTFLREYRPVDGMAAAYRRWAEAGAHFHYVSSTPWQLHAPLAEFGRAAGFPAGEFHLKRFRLKDSSVLALLADPFHPKLVLIERLLARFPKRQFVLVGDSGEQDPEVYATLARRTPEQIRRIYISNVSGDTMDAPRYRAAFRDVPPEKWRLFDDPAELEWPDEASDP